MAKAIARVLPLMLAAATPTFADEITLTTHTGGTVITGEFVEFSDGNFVLVFEGQELSVSADLVICEGLLCTDALTPTSEG